MLPSEREHVGPFIEKNPAIFKNGALKPFRGLQSYRWTLDEPEDLELLSFIFQQLYTPGVMFYTHDILELFEKKPEMKKINASITRNEGYKKSLLAENGDLYE